MRALSSENTAALAARQLVPRDFLWLVARSRANGDPEAVGFWSDVGNVSAQVVDPDTGTAVTRSFYGSGSLIEISGIPAVSTVEVQTVTIRMSQIHDLVEQAVREYDAKQARVEVYRGLFDPGGRTLVAPAFCRFVGFVDQVEIKTPAENDEGYAELRCASHTQEMVRYNPETRSHASQQRRSSTDDFFKDVATVGEWEHFWGMNNGKLDVERIGGRRKKNRK